MVEEDLNIIIEHLEPVIGKWVLLEYANASRIIGKNRVLVSNFCPSRPDFEKYGDLIKMFRWTCESITDLHVGRNPIIVLDPQADEQLKPEDRFLASAAVIGGILGDHPPRGRTKELLTSRLENAIPRNIGDKQFSIDGAAYVANLVLNEGRRLEEIRFVDEPVIRRNLGGFIHEIHLPYRYPLLPSGKILLSEELLSYIKTSLAYDESELIGRKTNNHI